jgi:hypothetical protein
MLKVIIFSVYLAWFVTTAAADLYSPEPTDDWSIPTIMTSATSGSPVDSPTLIQGYADGQEYEVLWIEPDERGSHGRPVDVSSRSWKI